MARRKRIPYDPPSAKRKGRRKPILRADQIFLSRRMLFAKGAVVAAFSALAGKLGYMQVIERDVYRQQAEGNIRTWRTIKAARGMVYDRNGRELAANRRVWQVRLNPDLLPPGGSAARQAVLDRLIDQLELPDALVLDPIEVPRGAEETVYARIAQLLGRGDVAAWKEWVESEKKISYLVILEDNLSVDQAALCRAHLAELPGVSVMNVLEYRIANAGEGQRVVAKTDITRELAMKLEANPLDFPGVELDGSVLIRRYPGGEVMSHLLGYVGLVSEADRADKRNLTVGGNPIYDMDEIIGKDGLEWTMEPLLRGNKGGHWVEVDGTGLPVRVLPGTENPAVPGKNLALTVDLELQQAVSRILQEGLAFSTNDRKAKGLFKKGARDAGAGAVVAIDPRSGEVLAMVSFPHYDNQLFVEGISTRKFDEYKSDKAKTPLLDRTIRGRYPSGSTLKIFLAAAALNERKLTTGSTFTCTGGIRVPYAWDQSKGSTHPCWQPAGHQTLDVFGAIEQSCDVFFYNVGAPKQRIEDSSDFLHYRDVFDIKTASPRIGEKHYFGGLGIEELKQNLTEQFWFGQPTGIDLPAEEGGVVPDPQWLAETNPEANWSVSATINVSIGQGYFLTTPLQLALNTAAIANGGTIHRPLLVREAFDDAREHVQQFEPRVLRTMQIGAEHIEVVKEGMRRVVHDPAGSAHSLGGVTKWPKTNPPGEPEILIAGKTGTAEIGEADDQGIYDRQHAWFTCFAPLDKPEIALAVVVEDGGEGASYAVPIADQVLRAYFELTGKRPRGGVLAADGSTNAAPPPTPTPAAEAPPAGAPPADVPLD